MHLCLFEDDQIAHLQPLTLTRAVYDLRIGIRTLSERLIEAFPDAQAVLHARPALARVTAQALDRVVNRIPGTLDVLFLNGRWFAEEGEVLEAVRRVAGRERERVLFMQDDVCVAAWIPEATSEIVERDSITPDVFPRNRVEEVAGARLVSRLWHPLDLLEDAIHDDFRRRTKGYRILERPGASIAEGALLASAERIFVGAGGTVRAGAVLNAEDGPIYIDEGAIVMENAVIRGPAYIGPRAQVKIAGIIETAAVGTWCKVGGEIHHTIVHSYSAKPHAGFLGHAYIGQWCNLGADTNNSNLKNDYGRVTLHNSVSGEMETTDRQFMGMVMGDHSKSGINAMFNTGTVVGVFCNLYGSGYLPRYVPSFSWGTPEEMVEYRIDKALRVAEAVMARRGVALTDVDRELLTYVYESTRRERAGAAAS